MLSAALTICFMVAMFSSAACRKKSTATALSPSPEVVDLWKVALERVEQDRGEAVGRKATVEIPEQLKHYADRYRFLAVQTAYSREEAGGTDNDFADLLAMIDRNELVELKALGTDYVLYGLGYSANGEPFTHYDQATTQEIPLAATDEDIAAEVERASAAVKESAARIIHLESELRRVPRKDRATRLALTREVSSARKTLELKKEDVRKLTAFCADAARRRSLLAEFQTISEAARDFAGETYNLADADSRRRFKIRLLGFIRPEARDVLLQIARAYKERFDRPLPVSSLVRPVQYQRQLGRTNANVARGPLPPHSTGLAFDLYYRYMSAAEQEYLMSMIAGLKDEGRVEALRETRDNIHVYVFGKGRPPSESLIARALADEKAKRPDKPRKKLRVARR